MKRTAILLSMMSMVLWAGLVSSMEEGVSRSENCVSEQTGISFNCDPTWKLTQQGKMLTVTIKDEPRVKMVISESDSALHFASELTRSALESLGRYAPEFSINRTRMCDREMVQVSGFLKDDPSTMVLDYYLIDHLRQHALQFNIATRENWEQYRWVVKDIVDSIRFVGQDTSKVYSMDPIDGSCGDLVKQETGNSMLSK